MVKCDWSTENDVD